MSFNDGDLHIKVEELGKDNSALRELAKSLVNASCHTCEPFSPWFRCEHFDGCECDLVNTAKELGVEV